MNTVSNAGVVTLISNYDVKRKLPTEHSREFYFTSYWIQLLITLQNNGKSAVSQTGTFV